MKNTKKLMALLLVVAMLFTFVSVIAACKPQDECEKNGHKLTAVAQKDATLQEAGYEAYWKCDVCGKMFSDKDGKNEISKPVEIPKLTPEPGPQPEQHVCKHVCPTCGKCTDSTCTDPVCEDKCPGHQQDEPEKGLTKDNPLTPDEAIALMDKAGSGNVVNPSNKDGYYVQGVVNAGSTVDTQYHEWDFTMGTGTKKMSCGVKIDSSVSNKPNETNGALDGATVIVKGFLELYNGKYQCDYLPANVSPTGAKFTPSIVDIQFPEEPAAEVESVSILNGSVDYTGKTAYLLPLADNAISFTAKVGPANAPQDIVWTVTNGDKATVSTTDVTSALTASASVKYKDQTGSVTLTATAKDTNVSATVTVEIRDLKGSKESDPMTVDEAISLMEATPGEYLNSDSRGHGFYIKGTVAAGSTVNAAGTWSFILAGTNSKSIECSVEGSKLNGIQIPNMAGGLDGCQIILYAASLAYVNEAHTAKGNMNELKSCTFPALTAIEIEAEQTEVTVPYSIEITVKSITPANAVFENVEWLTSDETKATVSGDTTKATVTTISAGEVKISVKCASVISNEITLTLSKEQEEEQTVKAVYDWSDALSVNEVVDNIYDFEIEFVDMLQFVNTWSSEQTEITAISGMDCMTVMDASIGKGFAYDASVAFGDGSLTISTLNKIQKVTFQIVPFADATTTQLSVNGISKTQEKGRSAYDGKVGSMFSLTVELSEATNALEVAFPQVDGNSFAIVGITLEAGQTSANKFSADWSDALSANDVVDNIYDFEIEFVDMLQFVNTWSSEQTEITAISGMDCMTVMDSSIGKGFAYDASVAFGDGSLTISTKSKVQKITFQIVPFADATTTQLSVNGVSKTQEKGSSAYDGKVGSMFSLTVELSEATNALEVAFPQVDGNSFAIVGITFEW